MVWNGEPVAHPGEVGASAVQNIGAYGVEVKDLITAVETVNIQAEERVYSVEECGYTYRNSIFKRRKTSRLLSPMSVSDLVKRTLYVRLWNHSSGA